MFRYDDEGYAVDCDKGDCIFGDSSLYLNYLREQYTNYIFTTYSEEDEQFEHWGNVGEMLRYGAKHLLPQWKKSHPKNNSN